MSTPDHINIAREKGGSREALTDVMEEGIAFQILQRLGRIESQLGAIDNRLSGGGPRKVVAEKSHIRNQLIALLQKGWLSEVEAIERTGWQTIGVRSFVTKLRTLGLVVEEEERDGVKHFKIAK